MSSLLLISACSGGEATGAAGKSAGQAGVFDSVKVKVEDQDTVPEVEFDAPLEITESAAKIVYTGDGDTVAEGQSITFKFVALNAEDGSVLGDTYEDAASALPVNEQLKEQDPALYEVLLGAKVGSQVAYAFPDAQAAAQSEGAETEQAAQPTQVMVLSIQSTQDTVATLSPDEAASRKAEGNLLMSPEDVSALETDGKLPKVSFGEDGVPAVEIPENMEEPDKLIVKVLEEGEGAAVEETGTVKVDYLGVSQRDGSTFDSSYERGEPAEFPLDGVIPGWTHGLAGQKAGSKVLLVLPSELAYGDPAPSGNPAGPLVFVVDIQEVK
ncbi:FKBP-type peptidyl-prolyl cis-trans isomerase [Arthrobacter sp. zg-Y820]|uniref:FKBP-type peptidyl-prolyl cis-trans isomerase n=1 Tax=unclassified Arthrobacter TaxID=235627 RepID=UPI001E395466|nr:MULTISPECIES: FKBP-type peptidyl-prolyl cis-trans isomerase [unclassified Arthrobacter]MCC9196690.1 FKBP-type peptidyl-prolyl cis-trans isomerase [Arthrobacter sp. zg-Y820]MDK1279552.1 FKBP-type peptidyl-prolyl cis-trans isomerase [Arthrobacter sp. zg.Y820]WIB08074.1 FKBP-type peptidyl-prolyl cis-trans isomerase [Arthrobacter sp. zg-Y820]